MEQLKVNKSEKQIIIKKSQWDKIIKLVDKLDGISDVLEKADFRIKVYDDLADTSLKLRGEVFGADKEKQEVKVKLGEVYEKGFKSGISFCNDTVGEFGDRIDDNIFYGHLPRSFDWDRSVEKTIKRDIKNIK